MRIEKHSQGGKITIRLIGHFQSEHVEELQKQLLRQNGPRFVFDLTELTLVDLEVIRFLGICEAAGTEVINCAPYIREWMNEERKARITNHSELHDLLEKKVTKLGEKGESHESNSDQHSTTEG